MSVNKRRRKLMNNDQGITFFESEDFATTSITNGTDKVIEWDSWSMRGFRDFDGSILTINDSDFYLINYYLQIADNANNNIFGVDVWNGTGTLFRYAHTANIVPFSIPWSETCTAIVYLEAGDDLRCIVWQNNGTVTVNAMRWSVLKRQSRSITSLSLDNHINYNPVGGIFFKAIKTTNSSIPDSEYTIIPDWETVTNRGFSFDGETLEILKGGIYTITANFEIDGDLITSDRYFSLNDETSVLVASSNRGIGSSGHIHSNLDSIDVTKYFSSGTLIHTEAYQNFGSALDIIGSSDMMWCAVLNHLE